MNTKRKIVLASVLVIALLISNLIGGFIGFNKGFEAGLFLNGLESSVTVSMLRELRQGETEWPIRHLESKLDLQIYNVGINKNSNDSIYNMNKYFFDIDPASSIHILMKPAIKYRAEFPTSFPSDNIRKTVNETLKKYDNYNGK